jgi:hypothetical protein
MLIRKSDADSFKKVMAHAKGVSNVMVKFDWGIPSPDGRVEWTLWQSAWDDQTMSTLSQLEEIVATLGKRAFFTPRFVSYNGEKVGCHYDHDNTQPCGNMCLNKGRYCLLDPSPFHDRDVGASGADVVVENLRRKCIWKVVNEDEAEKGVGLTWWKYIKESGAECGQDENLFKEKHCAEKIMKKYDIDIRAVEKCMGPYGVDVDEKNPMLEEELKEQTALQLLRLPALYVDGVHARGRIDANSILGMICAGYGTHDPPAICSCANQGVTTVLSCVKAGGISNAAIAAAGGGFSFGSVLVIMMIVAGGVSAAGFVYWRRTQRQMRDQVRSILAEYMPLEDQGLLDGDDDDYEGHPMHPAARAAAKSPRGYMPSRGFLDDEDEDGV